MSGDGNRCLTRTRPARTNTSTTEQSGKCHEALRNDPIDRIRARRACSWPRRASASPSRPSICCCGENREPAHSGAIRMARCRRSNSTSAYVSETVAICEYVEETHPTPPLIGTTPEQRAEARMGGSASISTSASTRQRLSLLEGLKRFETRIVCVSRRRAGPEDNRHRPAALARRTDGRQDLHLRRTLHDGRHRVVLLARFRRQGEAADRENAKVAAWFERVGARERRRRERRSVASPRHCEERSDAAIQKVTSEDLDCFATLAMTAEGVARYSTHRRIGQLIRRRRHRAGNALPDAATPPRCP